MRVRVHVCVCMGVCPFQTILSNNSSIKTHLLNETVDRKVD